MSSIITAARTAEELAATFYGQGVADPRAANLGPVHNANNLNYFQAARYQEYEHVQIPTGAGAGAGT